MHPPLLQHIAVYSEISQGDELENIYCQCGHITKKKRAEAFLSLLSNHPVS